MALAVLMGMSTTEFRVEMPSNRPPSEGDPLVDLSPLRELGDDELVVELAQLFIDSTRPLLDEIRSSAARADMKGVARAAHSVKGASANMHAVALGAAAASLEEASKRGEISGTLTLVEVVEQRFADAAAYLAAELHLG